MHLFLLLLQYVLGTELPSLDYVGDSHYEFGQMHGKKFSTQVSNRILLNDQLQNKILPYYKTAEGKDLYDHFLKTHTETFPDYVDELRGIAQGSGQPFHVIFLLNMLEEFSYHVTSDKQYVEHCSDYILQTPSLSLVGHNEDYEIQDVNNTFWASVKFTHGTVKAFSGYTYAGALTTGGFGFNERGIAFSLNYVKPSKSFSGGLGRVFISRDLLQATDLQDGLKRITRDGQCTGHNYQLMNRNTQRILNVETAPHGVFETKEIKSGDPPYFHANIYQHLSIDQATSPSSTHRLHRVKELPLPTSASDILTILGDQKDQEYPIFHDEASIARGDKSGDYTLVTGLFDLQKGILQLYDGNPKQGKELIKFTIPLYDNQISQ